MISEDVMHDHSTAGEDTESTQETAEHCTPAASPKRTSSVTTPKTPKTPTGAEISSVDPNLSRRRSTRLAEQLVRVKEESEGSDQEEQTDEAAHGNAAKKGSQKGKAKGSSTRSTKSSGKSRGTSSPATSGSDPNNIGSVLITSAMAAANAATAANQGPNWFNVLGTPNAAERLKALKQHDEADQPKESPSENANEQDPTATTSSSGQPSEQKTERKETRRSKKSQQLATDSGTDAATQAPPVDPLTLIPEAIRQALPQKQNEFAALLRGGPGDPAFRRIRANFASDSVAASSAKLAWDLPQELLEKPAGSSLSDQLDQARISHSRAKEAQSLHQAHLQAQIRVQYQHSSSSDSSEFLQQLLKSASEPLPSVSQLDSCLAQYELRLVLTLVAAIRSGQLDATTLSHDEVTLVSNCFPVKPKATFGLNLADVTALEGDDASMTAAAPVASADESVSSLPAHVLEAIRNFNITEPIPDGFFAQFARLVQDQSAALDEFADYLVTVLYPTPVLKVLANVSADAMIEEEHLAQIRSKIGENLRAAISSVAERKMYGVADGNSLHAWYIWETVTRATEFLTWKTALQLHRRIRKAYSALVTAYKAYLDLTTKGVSDEAKYRSAEEKISKSRNELLDQRHKLEKEEEKRREREIKAYEVHRQKEEQKAEKAAAKAAELAAKAAEKAAAAERAAAEKAEKAEREAAEKAAKASEKAAEKAAPSKPNAASMFLKNFLAAASTPGTAVSSSGPGASDSTVPTTSAPGASSTTGITIGGNFFERRDEPVFESKTGFNAWRPKPYTTMSKRVPGLPGYAPLSLPKRFESKRQRRCAGSDSVVEGGDAMTDVPVQPVIANKSAGELLYDNFPHLFLPSGMSRRRSRQQTREFYGLEKFFRPRKRDPASYGSPASAEEETETVEAPSSVVIISSLGLGAARRRQLESQLRSQQVSTPNDHAAGNQIADGKQASSTTENQTRDGETVSAASPSAVSDEVQRQRAEGREACLKRLNAMLARRRERLAIAEKKFRFLQFDEETRPPWFGPIRKRGKVVDAWPRRPFARYSHLDYEQDSGDEWSDGVPPEEADSCDDDDDDEDDDDDDDEVDDEGEEGAGDDDVEVIDGDKDERMGATRADGLVEDGFLVPENEDPDRQVGELIGKDHTASGAPVLDPSMQPRVTGPAVLWPRLGLKWPRGRRHLRTTSASTEDDEFTDLGEEDFDEAQGEDQAEDSERNRRFEARRVFKRLRLLGVPVQESDSFEDAVETLRELEKQQQQARHTLAHLRPIIVSPHLWLEGTPFDLKMTVPSADRDLAAKESKAQVPTTATAQPSASSSGAAAATIPVSASSTSTAQTTHTPAVKPKKRIQPTTVNDFGATTPSVQAAPPEGASSAMDIPSIHTSGGAQLASSSAASNTITNTTAQPSVFTPAVKPKKRIQPTTLTPTSSTSTAPNTETPSADQMDIPTAVSSSPSSFNEAPSANTNVERYITTQDEEDPWK